MAARHVGTGDRSLPPTRRFSGRDTPQDLARVSPARRRNLTPKEQLVRTTRPGLTLFELVLVLAILVIAGALAIPAIDSMQAGPRLTAAADQVRASLNDARTRALDEHQPYRFACKDGTGQFKVAPDTSEYWPDGAAPGPLAGGGQSQAAVTDGTLPDKVVFACDDTAHGGAGGWQTVAVFLPDGTARDDGEVTIRTRGAAPTTVRVRSVTGMVETAALALPPAQP
jgi:Tfp pilus assembly protein FimT